MIVYFDTSALIKLVFDEPGSEIAVELWDRAEAVASSQLVYPEARAAAAAAHRGGRIDAGTLRSATREIDELFDELTVIGLDDPLARSAGRLAQQRALRGYDAVHLASALTVDAEDLVVATWDRDLADAAIAEALAVAPAPS
ncbi:type II toxin-antitoxin system VapC family toxin [Conexibacter stalactiti]|uniref:Ribonuclease VapC n=1 Tax=Conexibacter stalactiti TaxID=1940611 RepID=A0ABU4HY54_9ACTN|nr:type II toxin-antitoxin system VapC family toxin [Conexibacter stalactiti]MDW5598263.1 type II toxin-antitoxin system VapC family toxin [Conexibacter stalactiti]MEC5038905.1 type II toxin-antitoxin system VapC family toxin [Conexibacter stalactiti]